MCQRICISRQWINFLLLAAPLLCSSAASFVSKDVLRHWQNTRSTSSSSSSSSSKNNIAMAQFSTLASSHGHYRYRHHHRHRHHRHYDQMKMSENANIDIHSDTNSDTNINHNSPPSRSPFMSELLNRFQGDFDNYHQVYADRKNGLLPKEGGGHEHFHVTLIPLNDDVKGLVPLLNGYTEHDNDDCSSKHNRSRNSRFDAVEGAVLAAYYFDGMPNRIFRLRLYSFHNSGTSIQTKKEKEDEDGNNNDNDSDNNHDNDNDEEQIVMKLYTLNPSLEGILRQTSGQALDTWLSTIEQYMNGISDDDGHGHGSHDNNQNEKDDSSIVKKGKMLTELKRCDIVWSKNPDPVRHSYFDEIGDAGVEPTRTDPSSAVHAIMINDHDIGGVKLESQVAPGLYIRIQDELSLWEDELWVNDRGHNAETGAMVYGNHAGIPYKMNRVASLVPLGDGKFERRISDISLSWTLGDEYRTSEQYDSKMEDIGGISTSYRPKKD